MPLMSRVRGLELRDAACRQTSTRRSMRTSPCTRPPSEHALCAKMNRSSYAAGNQIWRSHRSQKIPIQLYQALRSCARICTDASYDLSGSDHSFEHSKPPGPTSHPADANEGTGEEYVSLSALSALTRYCTPPGGGDRFCHPRPELETLLGVWLR
eukprot:2361476-Rhodomonas_salina.2